MRLGRRLVLLTAATTLLGSAGAAIAAGSPAAYAATTGAPAATGAQAISAAADQGNAGWVRCANLSQGTPEDVYLYSFGDPGNPTVLMNEGYGGVSSYMQLSAGEYTVAVRPVGAASSSPASITTSFMVSAGTNYTVASLETAAGRRLQVLQDQIAAPNGEALVRVIQASSKQPQVTVSIGADTLARQLALGSVTSYQAVQPGTPTVEFSTPDGHAAQPVTLAALVATAGIRWSIEENIQASKGLAGLDQRPQPGHGDAGVLGGGARPACAARRWRNGLTSARPGTHGSNKDAAADPRPTCSIESHAP